MKVSHSEFYALGVLAATALLAGCSHVGAQSSGLGFGPAAPGITQSGTDLLSRPGIPTIAVKAGPSNPDHRKSWVSPDLNRAGNLLFISDYSTDDVYIYKMPVLSLKGVLTDFDGPQGECSDNSGNVWITNTGSSQILKYSHAGTLLKTLNDPGEDPVGCAVDPKTGNLAVTNIGTPSEGPGEVLIFPNGSGNATAYTNPSQYYYLFAGYDTRGNLFEDGRSLSSGAFMLSELRQRRGSRRGSLETISLSGGTIYFPGMVQWYPAGGYLAVGDQQCGDQYTSCVYWVSISGTAGTITGTTNLVNSASDPVCDLVQGVLLSRPKSLAGTDDALTCGSYLNSSTNLWPFPAGEYPIDNGVNPGYITPVGAALSVKT